jgi:hypothetical protein
VLGDVPEAERCHCRERATCERASPPEPKRVRKPSFEGEARRRVHGFPWLDSEVFMLSKLLPRNESALDRGIRVALGLALLSLTLVGPHTLWGLVGLVPLVTGAAGSCPLYRLFGLSTCPVDPASTKRSAGTA